MTRFSIGLQIIDNARAIKGNHQLVLFGWKPLLASLFPQLSAAREKYFNFLERFAVSVRIHL